MMRRIDNFTARHPILSMIVGYLLLVAFALKFLPPDPPSVDVVAHRSTT
jgi:hypothetical protein